MRGARAQGLGVYVLGFKGLGPTLEQYKGLKIARTSCMHLRGNLASVQSPDPLPLSFSFSG